MKVFTISAPLREDTPEEREVVRHHLEITDSTSWTLFDLPEDTKTYVVRVEKAT